MLYKLDGIDCDWIINTDYITCIELTKGDPTNWIRLEDGRVLPVPDKTMEKFLTYLKIFPIE